MKTSSEEYQDYLVGKYRRGRGLYLRLLVYPKYLKALGERCGREIVDCGCGTGEFLRFCQTSRIPARGIDWNEHLVARCRQAGLDASVADITTYEPPNGKLHNLLCDNVIEHLTAAEIESFFAKLRQIVDVGGKMLVVVPGKKGYRSDPSHRTFVTLETMQLLCRRHQIALCKTFYCPLNFRAAGDFFYLNMSVFLLTF
jgi:SAM-dependent methyltransferase